MDFSCWPDAYRRRRNTQTFLTDTYEDTLQNIQDRTSIFHAVRATMNKIVIDFGGRVAGNVDRIFPKYTGVEWVASQPAY